MSIVNLSKRQEGQAQVRGPLNIADHEMDILIRSLGNVLVSKAS